MDSSLTGLSDQGKQWLVTALDPYHDFQQTLRGYPDQTSSRSVVKMINQSLSITAPVGCVGNWDCRIVYTALDGYTYANADKVTVGTMFWQEEDGAAYSSKSIRPFMVFTAPSGTEPNMSNYYGGTASMVGLDTITDLNSAAARTIACAFEVHNTTAALNKQGQLTVAMPSIIKDKHTQSHHNSIGAGTGLMPYSTYLTQPCGPIPATVADIRMVPESGQWEAARGVYCIPRLNGVPPTFRPWTNNPVCYFEGNSAAQNWIGSTVVYNSQHRYAVDGISTAPVGYGEYLGYSMSAFSPMVVNMAGLSLATTITVSLRTVVEIFPVMGDPLVSSSQLSPPYDPFALTLYQMIASKAPFAVPVDMNDAGQYFKMILNTIRDMAPKFAPLLGAINPALGLIAGGVGMGAGTLANLIREKPPPQQYVQPLPQRIQVVPRYKQVQNRQPKKKQPIQVVRKAAGSGAVAYN